MPFCPGLGEWSFGSGLLMLGLMVGFWAAVIYIGVRIFRALLPPPRGGDLRSILEERFARGDIDAEEFERIRRTLGPEEREAGARV